MKHFSARWGRHRKSKVDSWSETGLTADWEAALALWHVQLRPPKIRPGEGKEYGSFAWYSYPPQVNLDPELAVAKGAGEDFVSIFAHEIGHHVLAPGTRIDALKVRHQMARCLALCGAAVVDLDDAALLSNVWTDLLINTRLAIMQGRADPTVVPGIIRQLRALAVPTSSRLGWLYMRTYERAWSLPAGTMCQEEPPPPPPPVANSPVDEERPVDAAVPAKYRALERELRAARLAARELRAELDATTATNPQLDADALADAVIAFADDAVAGSLAFGMIAAPYLLEDARGQERLAVAVGGAGCGAGMDAATAGELGKVLADPRMREDPNRSRPSHPRANGSTNPIPSEGQDLGLAATMKLYASVDPDQIMVAWYRAAASRWVKPWRRRRAVPAAVDLPGPTETWDAGDDLADIDWPATLTRGATVIPGVTTRRRTHLVDGTAPTKTGLTLDLYIDSSGSMTRPENDSPAVLAAVILALSVLRGGGSVRVTSFSGPGQVMGGADFLRKEGPVLRDIFGFYGGGTSFPLDLYGARYAGAGHATDADQRHVVVISDDGLTSMFGDRNEPFSEVAHTVKKSLTSGTLLLVTGSRRVEPMAKAAGYEAIFLKSMDDAPAACAVLAKQLRAVS